VNQGSRSLLKLQGVESRLLSSNIACVHANDNASADSVCIQYCIRSPCDSFTLVRPPCISFNDSAERVQVSAQAVAKGLHKSQRKRLHQNASRFQILYKNLCALWLKMRADQGRELRVASCTSAMSHNGFRQPKLYTSAANMTSIDAVLHPR
jgi:hypothetical protein